MNTEYFHACPLCLFSLPELTSQYVIVDLDTGTVTGANVALVHSRYITEDELSNDSLARAAAVEHGFTLYVNLDEKRFGPTLPSGTDQP